MNALHIYFSGNVQGVGFRYTARQVANGFSITGWVKNLKDGRVELLAEGEKTELEKFFAELRKKMERHIRETEMAWGAASNQFTVFEITY